MSRNKNQGNTTETFHKVFSIDIMANLKRIHSCLIFVCFMLCCNLVASADPLTDLEKWQAEKINSYLQSEKFIFTYCDCCSKDNFEVVEISSVNIEPISERLYQVRVKGKSIAKFDTDLLGNLSNPVNVDKIFNDVISVNYTFVFHQSRISSLSTSLGISIVGGYEATSCMPYVLAPSPTSQNLIDNPSYKTAHESNVQYPNEYAQLILSWKLIGVRDHRGNEENGNLPNWKIVLRDDKTFFTTISEGGTGKWSAVDGILTFDLDDSDENLIFHYKVDDGKLTLIVESTKSEQPSYYVLTLSKSG